MKQNAFEPLEWDSQFFGYPVGSIHLNQEGLESLDELFEQTASQKIRLTYLFVSPTETDLNDRIAAKGAVLVDQKTEYVKASQKHHDFSNQIVEFDGVTVNDKIIELALQAGVFSRFHTDKNFNKGEYERLYTEWITKSINKTIAFKTLVAKNDTDLIGITTLGKKEHSVSMGLVAIDEKYRGQGIGCDLIHSADTIAFDMGFREIKVVTQGENEGACRLYTKCGFEVGGRVNVYHFWQ